MAKPKPVKKSGKKSGKSKKAKPTAATPSTFAPAAPAVHTRCFTAPGEKWVSTVNHAADGSFSVGDGPAFNGHHSSGTPIHGSCSGTRMHIVMPMIGGVCIYDGPFIDDFTIRGGTRICQGFPLVAGAPAPPGDPWDADKET